MGFVKGLDTLGLIAEWTKRSREVMVDFERIEMRILSDQRELLRIKKTLKNS